MINLLRLLGKIVLWKSLRSASQHQKNEQRRRIGRLHLALDSATPGFRKMEIQFTRKKITVCRRVLAKRSILYGHRHKMQNSSTSCAFYILNERSFRFLTIPFFLNCLLTHTTPRLAYLTVGRYSLFYRVIAGKKPRKELSHQCHVLQ